MAVNLEAIRKRVLELSGQRQTSSVQLWKPGPGEYKIRGLNWKNTTDGMPFIERRFYYLGDNQGILAPYQFGKPDPINDLIRKLYSSGKPDDRVLAKKLAPKMRAYMPIIVRGEEDKGVQVWSFGKLVYQDLLNMFGDEDTGDILDPLEGFDLKVSISPSPKKVDGRQFMDTKVTARPRSSPLSDDPEQAKKWLDSVPNIDDMYRHKTEKEIEAVLNTWLAGGTATSESSDEGSSRGAPRKKDELDKLVEDVQSEVAAAPATAAPPAKRSKKAAEVSVDDAVPAKQQSLDDAFQELMSDDE